MAAACGDEQSRFAALTYDVPVRAKASCPEDLRRVLQHSLADAYEISRVLLARAGLDGTLQRLTSGWERSLGPAQGAGLGEERRVAGRTG